MFYQTFAAPTSHNMRGWSIGRPHWEKWMCPLRIYVLAQNAWRARGAIFSHGESGYSNKGRAVCEWRTYGTFPCPRAENCPSLMTGAGLLEFSQPTIAITIIGYRRAVPTQVEMTDITAQSIFLHSLHLFRNKRLSRLNSVWLDHRGLKHVQRCSLHAIRICPPRTTANIH